MIHEMHLYDDAFRTIKAKTKTIEMRLFDLKRRRIKVGDQIIFENTKNNERIITKVLGLDVYPDFFSLYSHYDKVSLGYLPEEKASASDMYAIYPRKDIAKYGVVAIRIELRDFFK